MSRWGKQFQLENKFIWKNWFFLLLPFIYGAISLFWLSQESLNTTVRPTQFLSIAHTLSLGIIFLVTVLSIRRDRHTELLEWTDTLPFTYVSKISVKFLTIFLYSLTFTCAFFVAFVITSPAYVNPFSIGISLSIQSQISYSVSISLGILLATAITNRIVYIIVFCAWMFGTFFMEVFIISRNSLFFLNTFHLNQFFIDNHYSVEVARNLKLIDITYSQLFVVGFTILLLSISVLIQAWKRHFSNKWRAILSVLFICCLTILSFLPYGNLWQDRFERVNMISQSAPTETEPKQALQKVDSYDITVQRLARNRLRVEAELAFPKPTSNEVTLTLYPFFEIKHLLLNGVEMDYERDFQLIKLNEDITLKDNNTLEIVYEGSLLEWGSKYSREVYYAYLHEEELYLPSYIAWYPLLGEKDIYTNFHHFNHAVVQTPSETKPIETRANFKVTAKDFPMEFYGTYDTKKELPDGSKQYEVNDATGISFIASNDLKEIIIDPDISVTMTASRLESMSTHAIPLVGAKEYLSSWLPTPTYDEKIKVLYLPYSLIGMQHYGTFQLDNALADDLDNQVFSYIEDQPIDQTYGQIAALYLSHLIYGKNYEKIMNHYFWQENSVAQYIYQAMLLVVYKDYYDYDWKELRDVHYQNLWGLSNLGHVATYWSNNSDPLSNFQQALADEHYHEHDKILLQIALAIEEGKIEQVKKLLATIHTKMVSSDEFYYSYNDWLKDWNTMRQE